MTNESFPGLDVILSTAIDEHRHAGLFMRDDMIFGSARLLVAPQEPWMRDESARQSPSPVRFSGQAFST